MYSGAGKVRLRKELFLYFILGFIVLYFVYSAALTLPFYHHDVYKYSTGGIHKACTSNQGHEYIISLGRPISAYLDCLNNDMGYTFAGMRYLRIFCALLSAFLLSVFALYLRHSGFTRQNAFLLSGAIFFLPMTATVMIMACSTLTVALLLAFAAHYFIARTEFSVHSRSVFYLLTGILFLLASFFTYPAMTAFFLMPALIKVLFEPLSAWKHTRKIVCRDVLIYFVISVCGFVLAKWLQQHMALLGIPPTYRFILNPHIFARVIPLLLWLPVFWNLDAGLLQTLFIFAFIFIACVCAFKPFYQNKLNSAYLMQAIIAVLILSGSGASVFLLSPSNEVALTRVGFVFQAMEIVILVWCFAQIQTLFFNTKTQAALLFSAFLFLTGAYCANYYVTLSALNDYTELNFITNRIAMELYSHKNFKRIHIIAPDVINYNGMRPHDDIFNFNSTFTDSDIANMVNTALLQIAQRHSFGVVNCVFSATESALLFKQEEQCINSALPRDIAVTYSLPRAPVYQSPDMLVIDMSTLRELVQMPKNTLATIATR
jgi:hypothetical protein